VPPESTAPAPDNSVRLPEGTASAVVRPADGAPWVTGLLVVVALGAGYLGAWFAMDPMRSELQTRPPVVVLDMATVLHGLSPEDADREIARQREIATRLADSGILVLDAQAIIAAPRALYLTREMDER